MDEIASSSVELALGSGVGVAVAQEGGEGGQFRDVTQDRVAVPGSDVVPLGPTTKTTSTPSSASAMSEVTVSRYVRNL
jgi:hypothetical protein